ncbi:MAG: Asp-tRNA(Asn)/Glu-tRNA(Gln) amidotransferase subunit GatC [Gammaproteobacteria bacterium]
MSDSKTDAKPGPPKTIRPEDLTRLARLARLEIPPAEAPQAARALNDILAMMETLRQADIPGGGELSHVQFWDKSLRLREDEARPGYAPEELLQDAPQTADGYFIVPKIIE